MARINLEDLATRPPAREEHDDDDLDEVAGGWGYVAYSPSNWGLLPIPVPMPALLPIPIPMPGATPISIP